MNDMKPTPDSCSTAPHYFIVAGISLTSIRKVLKPALPKKKQEGLHLVVITVTGGSIKVAIAGAAVELPAITSGSFVVELPYLQFKFILTDAFEDGALVRCELAPGSFSVNGLTTRSPQILIQPGGGGGNASEPASSAVEPGTPGPIAAHAAPPVIANPLDATVGLPLLAAYVYIRKYGIQRFAASKTFVLQQVEVDDLLKKADRLLGPVGITRSDLERLLDRKVGIT
jgi:hypothetical protein